MFGKVFQRMYTGSMMGAGPHVFSVWNYAITFAYDSRVELNPKLLAVLIGDTEERMGEAIEYLCRPDKASTHPEQGGRRMVREGQFQYFLPQWQVYQAINQKAKLRESNRARQEEHRARARGKSKRQVKAEGQARERRFLAAEGRGDRDAADSIAAEGLPVSANETPA